MEVWLDQGGCIIFNQGNMLLGFCQRDTTDTDGIITFFYNSKRKVDFIYRKISKNADSPPKENKEYKIYHFFSEDPDGRKVEFQTFLHPLPPYLSGEELLAKRRSVRRFLPDAIPIERIRKLLELCKYSPTSRNSESYYYILIQNEDIINNLGSVRGSSSTPIKKAPYCVAICVNPEKTKRVEADGHIAAYHFLLAAKVLGLGTCWIADMNRSEVKDLIKIPQNHYVATVTPLGYPDESKQKPIRRDPQDFFKHLL